MSSVLGKESARRFRQDLAKGPEGNGRKERVQPPRMVCWVRVTAVTFAFDGSGDSKGVVTHRVAYDDEWIDTSDDVRISPLDGQPLTIGEKYLAIRTGDFLGEYGIAMAPRFIALAPADEVDGTPREGLVSKGTQRWSGNKIFRDQVIVRPEDPGGDTPITGGTHSQIIQRCIGYGVLAGTPSGSDTATAIYWIPPSDTANGFASVELIQWGGGFLDPIQGYVALRLEAKVGKLYLSMGGPAFWSDSGGLQCSGLISASFTSNSYITHDGSTNVTGGSQAVVIGSATLIFVNGLFISAT